MRIVSDFTDYYDGTALSLDPGPTPLYRRTTRVTHEVAAGRLKAWDVPANRKHEETEAERFREWPDELRQVRDLWLKIPAETPFSWSHTRRLDVYLVVFCGRAHAIYRVWTSSLATKPHLHFIGTTELLASMHRTSDAEPGIFAGVTVLPARTQRQIDDWMRPDGGYYQKARPWEAKDQERDPKQPELTLRAVQAWDAADKTVSDDVHRLVGAPIFLVRHGLNTRVVEVVANPDLSPFGFVRAVDPFQAFQELDRMLSNVLVSQVDPPLTTGGDAIVRDAKGFDERSFKMAPEDNKKARRRARRGD